MFFLAGALTLSYGLRVAQIAGPDDLNKGVAENSRTASTTRPSSSSTGEGSRSQPLNARLYLATAYASQYIRALPSEENMPHGQLRPFRKYTSVLDMDPNKHIAHRRSRVD